MPIYEYACLDCQEKVEIIMSFSEKERGVKPLCPKCGGTKMAQVFGSFAVRGTSRSPNINFGGCDPSAGPGCCR